jgi:hypothetical protein
VLHHGGKATATISAPERACSDTVVIAMKLAISKAQALNQAGHRDAEMEVSCFTLEAYRTAANEW